MAGNSRLKVYSTHIGLHEWLVAARSQKAALNAWDVRENLFATGAAKVVTDAKAVKLAMEHPGEPVARSGKGVTASRVTRSAGSRKEGARSRQPARQPAGKPAKSKVKPVDRTKLDRAERALDELDGRLKRERTAIERKRRALELEAEGLEADFETQKERLEKALNRARRAFEAAER